MPFGVLIRMFVLGSVAVVASGYAVYRHYTFTPPPMLVSAPAPAPSESGLIPAPHLLPLSE
jgi:hypothetical protein